MKGRWVLASVGVALAIVGAVMALALEAEDPTALGLRLEPLGAIAVFAGIILVAAGALAGASGGPASRASTEGDTEHGITGLLPSAESFRSVGGLIAVVVGIFGVVALALVTLARLGAGTESSVVAIATSAFGVISAVVGAYLGIKTTADQSSEVRKDARVAEAQVGAANAVVQQLPDDERHRAERAMSSAAEKARRPAPKRSNRGE